MAEESPYPAPEVSDWDLLPRGPSGRPMITVTRPFVAPEGPYTRPPPPSEMEPEPIEDFNPWERAAERIRRSNVDKLPTPEIDWAKQSGVAATNALKSWYETTEGRYYPPNAASIRDDGTFLDKEGKEIPDQRKPNILPIAKDPTTGETQGAMPGILDMMNTIGSPVKGAATLGAGFTRGPRNPFGGGPVPPPPPMGHNQGPPMPPGGGVPPPPATAGAPIAPGPRQIIHGLDETPPITLNDIYTKTIDDLHPIKVMQNKIAEHGPLAPDEMGYELARLTRGSYGRTQQALDHGTFDFNTLKNNGMALKQVLKPVRNNLDDFEKYAVALRDMELRNRGIQTGADYVDAAARIAAAPPEYRTAVKNLHAYQDRMLQYLGDSGILSPEALKNMRAANKQYVPFYRALDNEFGDLMSSPKNIAAWQPIQKIKGSEANLLSPIESIVRNTHKFIDLAEKNRALNALVDAAQARGLHDLAERVPAGPGYRAAEDEIRVFKNGKPQFYKVDPDVAKAVNGMGRQEIDMVMRMVSAPARTLRAGAVLAPEFLAKNIVRDQLSAAIFSKNGYVPFYDYLRGVGHMAFKSNAYQNFLKSGGANSNLVTMERHYVRDQLQNMRETGWYDKIKNNKNPLKFLEKASEYSEQPTRVAEFVKGQNKGKTIHQSGFEGREVSVDFGRHGASQALRMASQSTAFLNPTLQGHDRLARAFKDNPYRTSFKIGAYVTLPTLMAYAYNRSDPRMMSIPRQERDTFWHYPTNDWQPVSQKDLEMMSKHGAGPLAKDVPGWIKTENGKTYVNQGTIYRIPKPHEMGVFFGSSVERSLDAYFEKHPEAFKGFQKSMMSAAMPPMLPQAALAPVEAWSNYKFFTESPLVPKRLQSPRDRRYEYTPFTTETAKIVGNAIGQVAPESQFASPIVLENYVQNWSGTLGRYTLQILDASMEGGKQAASKIAGHERKPKVKAEWSEADYPGWKAFVSRMPTTAASDVRDFYENVESSTTIKALINRIGKSNEFEREEQRSSARTDIAGGAFPLKMAKTSIAISRMFRAMEMINNNRDMTAADKRKAIDMLSINIMYATGEANKMFRAAQEAAKKRPQ